MKQQMKEIGGRLIELIFMMLFVVVGIPLWLVLGCIAMLLTPFWWFLTGDSLIDQFENATIRRE